PRCAACPTDRTLADARRANKRRRRHGPSRACVIGLRMAMSHQARRRLLIVAHAPSENTRRLREAAIRGATSPDISGVDVKMLPPLETVPADVLAADAIILGTTENLGYMSGALKDFFDRCYYPVLELKQGLPYAAFIRAKLDGTGARRAIESITTGLRWRAV